MALALFPVLSANAQDRIYFNDSRIVDAVVDEVGDNYIYYRLYGNQEGPVCSTAIYNVYKIIYHNGEEQTFTGGIYDERMFFDESMRALLNGQPVKMRFDSGNLYLGSRSRYGAMQADYVAFNLYGDEYYAARKNWKWGSSLTWIGSMFAAGGLTFWAISGGLEGGIVLTAAGAACLGAGIPLWVKGSKKLKGIADDYNSRNSGPKSAELTFGPCQNGVGFALNF